MKSSGSDLDAHIRRADWVERFWECVRNVPDTFDSSLLFSPVSSMREKENIIFVFLMYENRISIYAFNPS